MGKFSLCCDSSFNHGKFIDFFLCAEWQNVWLSRLSDSFTRAAQIFFRQFSLTRKHYDETNYYILFIIYVSNININCNFGFIVTSNEAIRAIFSINYAQLSFLYSIISKSQLVRLWLRSQINFSLCLRVFRNNIWIGWEDSTNWKKICALSLASRHLTELWMKRSRYWFTH